MRKVLLAIAAGAILSTASLMLNRVEAMPLAAQAGVRLAIENDNIVEQVRWACKGPKQYGPITGDVFWNDCWWEKDRAYAPRAPRPQPPTWQGQRFRSGPYLMRGGGMRYRGY